MMNTNTHNELIHSFIEEVERESWEAEQRDRLQSPEELGRIRIGDNVLDIRVQLSQAAMPRGPHNNRER